MGALIPDPSSPYQEHQEVPAAEGYCYPSLLYAFQGNIEGVYTVCGVGGWS